MGEPWYQHGHSLILAVKLTPKSHQEKLGPVIADSAGEVWLSAKVRAVPEGGKANQALISLVSKSLGVARRDIVLEAGKQSHHKRLRVSGIGDGVLDKLTGIASD